MKLSRLMVLCLSFVIASMVVGLIIQSSVEAEATGVDGAEAGAVLALLNMSQDKAHLFLTQDDWKSLGLLRFDEGEDGHVAPEGVAEKEADAGEGLVEAVGGELALIHEKQEELAQFFVGDLVG